MKGTSSLLTFLGAINWDTTIFEDEFAEPGGEVAVRQVAEGPGGKGANAAVAASKLLGGRKVAFLGAVGADRNGRALRSGLKTEGVIDAGLVTLRDARTGTAHIIVDRSGSKTIHTHFGANERLGPANIETRAARRVLSSSSTVVIMDVPLRTAQAAARAAKRGGARLVYSPGVRCAEGMARLSSVLGATDDAVFDRSELLKLLPSRDPEASVLALTRLYPSLSAVTTLGPAGSLVGRGGTVTRVPPVDLSAFGLKAVNSTGSGDAFLAAYVCYSSFGRPSEEAAYWGNLAGALKAADARTRGSPTRRALAEKMSKIRPLLQGSPPSRDA